MHLVIIQVGYSPRCCILISKVCCTGLPSYSDLPILRYKGPREGTCTASGSSYTQSTADKDHSGSPRWAAETFSEGWWTTFPHCLRFGSTIIFCPSYIFLLERRDLFFIRETLVNIPPFTYRTSSKSRRGPHFFIFYQCFCRLRLFVWSHLKRLLCATEAAATVKKFSIDFIDMFDLCAWGFLRPSLEALENCMDCVCSAMVECWREQPDERPDFKTIRAKLRPMRKGLWVIAPHNT